MGLARGEGNTINKGMHEWYFEKFNLGNQAKSRQRVAITPHRGSSHITSLVHSLRGHWKFFCDSLVAQHLHADDSVYIVCFKSRGFILKTYEMKHRIASYTNLT
jgi:hypothetical protein